METVWILTSRIDRIHEGKNGTGRYPMNDLYGTIISVCDSKEILIKIINSHIKMDLDEANIKLSSMAKEGEDYNIDWFLKSYTDELQENKWVTYLKIKSEDGDVYEHRFKVNQWVIAKA